MPLSTDVLKKFFDKSIEVAGDAANAWVKKKIAETPAPQVGQPAGRPPMPQVGQLAGALPAPQIAHLQLIKGGLVQGQCDLGGRTIVLGRQNIDPADPAISRQHIQIFCHDGEYWVVDLKSANGTFLNAERITHAHVLRTGDQIRIGQAVLVFSEENR